MIRGNDSIASASDVCDDFCFREVAHLVAARFFNWLANYKMGGGMSWMPLRAVIFSPTSGKPRRNLLLCDGNIAKAKTAKTGFLHQ